MALNDKLTPPTVGENDFAGEHGKGAIEAPTIPKKIGYSLAETKSHFGDRYESSNETDCDVAIKDTIDRSNR